MVCSKIKGKSKKAGRPVGLRRGCRGELTPHLPEEPLDGRGQDVTRGSFYTSVGSMSRLHGGRSMLKP